MPGRRREWFDDDAFWRDLYPYIFTERRFEAAVDDTRKVIRLVRPRGKAVLDLACGPGRFAIAFAKRGYRVTGVDRTKFFLDRARDRARAGKASVEWIRQDMRDFVRPDTYDLAICMYTSFGYFQDPGEDVHVLRQVFESLRPGGALVIDVMGKEQIAARFAPVNAEPFDDGALLVQRRAIQDDWTRIWNEWTIVRRGRASSYEFTHTIYSGRELRDRFVQAGYSDVKLYGNFDGEPYGLTSPHLVAVGRKGRGA